MFRFSLGHATPFLVAAVRFKGMTHVLRNLQRTSLTAQGRDVCLLYCVCASSSAVPSDLVVLAYSRAEEERLRAAVMSHEAVVQRNESELRSYRCVRVRAMPCIILIPLPNNNIIPSHPLVVKAKRHIWAEQLNMSMCV
jgi:hypothetical protein